MNETSLNLWMSAFKFIKLPKQFQDYITSNYHFSLKVWRGFSQGKERSQKSCSKTDPKRCSADRVKAKRQKCWYTSSIIRLRHSNVIMQCLLINVTKRFRCVNFCQKIVSDEFVAFSSMFIIKDFTSPCDISLQTIYLSKTYSVYSMIWQNNDSKLSTIVPFTFSNIIFPKKIVVFKTLQESLFNFGLFHTPPADHRLRFTVFLLVACEANESKFWHIS